MKPILFNTEMVRAILDNRKTVTRRVVKPRYCDSVFEMFGGELCEVSPYKPPIDNGDGTTTRFVRQYAPCKPPCRPGDILYVRETWTQDGDVYRYKAGFYDQNRKWRPSIHMPQEAARIFLRVIQIEVQQVKDVTDDEAIAEGFTSRAEFISSFLKMYPDCTEDSWCWVIRFEKLKSRPL